MRKNEKRTRFTPDPYQRILRHGRREFDLLVVGEVEIVDAAYQSFETLLLAQRLGELADQRRLADALHAVQPDDERARGPRLEVRLQPLKDEGDADRAFVIVYLGISHYF